MNSLLQKLSLITRASDWRLSFVPFIMGTVYMWLWWFEIPFSASTLWLVLLSLLTTIGFAALGYFINEFFDKEADRNAGKINKLAYVSATVQLSVLAVALLLTFLPWIWLPTTVISWVLIATQIGLFLIYSLPFPRLKEHIYLSVIIDASYAYVVPLALSFYTFNLLAGRQDIPHWFYLFLAATFFIGLRNIAIHQAKDVLKDASAGVKLLPMLLGINGTNTLVLTLLCYETFFWALAGVMLSIQKSFITIYFGLHILAIFPVLKRIFFQGYSPLAHHSRINHLYLYLFPPSMLLMASFQHPLWLSLLPLHLFALIPLHFLQKIRNIAVRYYYPVRSFILVKGRKLLSASVNYPIYYAFKLIGIDLIKENKTAADVLFGKRNK